MIAAGLLPGLFDDDVVTPEVGLWDDRIDPLVGSASFSLTFDLGAQDESPSLPHVTLSFILGSPSPLGSTIGAVISGEHGSFGFATAELGAGKASLSREAILATPDPETAEIAAESGLSGRGLRLAGASESQNELEMAIKPEVKDALSRSRLTQRQALHPEMEGANRGTQVHNLIGRDIRNTPSLNARLTYNRIGVDLRSNLGFEWEVTTPGQYVAHIERFIDAGYTSEEALQVRFVFYNADTGNVWIWSPLGGLG